MDLVTDNQSKFYACIPKIKLFHEQNLRHLSSLLKCNDAISLLYLMCEGDACRGLYNELLLTEACGKSKKVNFYYLCVTYVAQWELKIVEALVEVGLFLSLMEVFGVNKIDAQFNVNASDRRLNHYKIRIFRVCDGMDSKTQEMFLSTLSKMLDNYCLPSFDHKYLELYFLFWEMFDMINPSSGKGFQVLTTCLESIGANILTDIIMDVETKLASNYTLDTYPIQREDDVGLCVIVNQFDFRSSLNNRASSCLDENYLTGVMKKLNFSVVTLHNLGSLDFVDIIKTTINVELRNHHSILFLTIMSHGEMGTVMGQDGASVKVSDITDGLHLVTKLNKIPKIFVVCACRGEKFYSTHVSGNSYGVDGSNGRLTSDIMDLVTLYSTIPGFVSLRNKEKGSLFMQVLCDVIEKNSHLEICELFTIVNRTLMFPKDFRIYNPAKIAHPCEFNSRLLKKLFLKKID